MNDLQELNECYNNANLTYLDLALVKQLMFKASCRVLSYRGMTPSLNSFRGIWGNLVYTLEKTKHSLKNLWSRSPYVRCEEFQLQEVVSSTLIFRPKSFATTPPMHNFPIDRDMWIWKWSSQKYSRLYPQFKYMTFIYSQIGICRFTPINWRVPTT